MHWEPKLERQLREGQKGKGPSCNTDQYVQEEFLSDVVLAVPAHVVFDEDWVPAMPCTFNSNPALTLIPKLWKPS